MIQFVIAITQYVLFIIYISAMIIIFVLYDNVALLVSIIHIPVSVVLYHYNSSWEQRLLENDVSYC